VSNLVFIGTSAASRSDRAGGQPSNGGWNPLHESIRAGAVPAKEIGAAIDAFLQMHDRLFYRHTSRMMKMEGYWFDMEASP
jgi:hypothetical protein